MSIGENIRFYRKKNKLSQKELSKLCNISEISIRKYESNERKPKIETIKKIADALNVSIIQLDNARFDLSELYNELDNLRTELIVQVGKLPNEDWFGEEWHSIHNNYMKKIDYVRDKIALLENEIPKHKQDYETSGEKIKRLRREKGFDLMQFSDSTNIPIQLLKRIENNSRSLTLDVLSKIARCLNIAQADIDPNLIFNWNFNIDTEQDILYKRLLNNYEKLNEEGQKKVVEYVEILSQIPDFLTPEEDNEE